jgi:hypothetical protein
MKLLKAIVNAGVTFSHSSTILKHDLLLLLWLKISNRRFLSPLPGGQRKQVEPRRITTDKLTTQFV